jgi:hypothetical protein
MSFDIVNVGIASAVATSGTITVPYPTGKGAGSYPAYGHKIWIDSFQTLLEVGSDFTISFGASNITVTYTGSTTIPAGSSAKVQLNLEGADSGAVAEELPATLDNGVLANVLLIELGAPIAADPNGICEAQSDTGAHSLTLDGALVSGGVATLDVPRNIVIDSGGADTAVLTITGTDEYGNTIVESITLNGTTAVAGKKAFKTVTSVESSGTISNDAFVGTGDVLGLPVFLPETGYLLKELEDGADASAGTLVAGVSTTATATTGDVRGTYDPNSAADGSKVFTLIAAIPDISYLGVSQYAG